MLSPLILAAIALFTGTGTAAFGVYLLFGLGWAALAASVPFFWLAFVLFRGLKRAA